MDDFRIYVNALAASDVLALFNGTAGALASPWTSQDIGSLGLPGSSGSPGDDVYVTASGSDIWDVSDNFHYVSRTWTGDGTLTARVNGLSATDAWTKAGLMFRESLDANARNAFIAVTPGNGISFQSRSSTGGGTTFSNIVGLAATVLAEAPTHGQRVHALPLGGWHHVDSDGRTRDLVPADDLLCRFRGHRAQQHPAHRRAVRSHLAGRHRCPHAPTGLTATAGNAQVVLNWSAASDATSYNVKRATVSGGPYTTVTNVATTSYTDTGLVSGTTYYYVVAATNVYGVSSRLH